MPKQLLSGTLDEQCAFLYELGREKMEQGNYTGAIHAFREIVKHAPNYADTADLLSEAQRRKSEQRLLIISAFAGAIVLLGVGSLLNLKNDLYLLVLVIVGTLLGYVAGNAINSRRVNRTG